jgi:hypothetical protein
VVATEELNSVFGSHGLSSFHIGGNFSIQPCKPQLSALERILVAFGETNTTATIDPPDRENYCTLPQDGSAVAWPKIRVATPNSTHVP